MILGADAPTRIDLYVEKIVSYMNLDDTQREEVVRELRSHLEEAIDDAVARGISRDRAEEEAMERFGSPEVLAGKFGRLSGSFWVLFEALGYALAVGALYIFIIRQLPSTQIPSWVTFNHILIIAAFAAFVTLVARMWNRVQVNGSLRIYRFLRPTLIIPFDAITGVNMERFHLFGAKKVKISYAGKTAQYSTGWRNARCVGIALEVLVPKAIKPRAATYFRKLRLTDNQESVVLRLGLSAVWLILGAILLYNFGPLWRGEGVSIAFAIVLIGAMLFTWLQYYVHVNRAKRGGVAILAAAGTFFLIPVAVQRAIFSTEGFGAMALLMAIMLPLPLVMLWWKGRSRIAVVTVTAVWFGIGTVAFFRAPQPGSFNSAYLGKATGYVDPGMAVWVRPDADESAKYAVLGMVPQKPSDQHVLHTVDLNTGRKGNLVESQFLPPGWWKIAGSERMTSGPLFLRDISAEESESGEAWTEIYRMSVSGTLAPMDITTNTNALSSNLLYPQISLSPNGRYFVTTKLQPDSQHLAVQDLETRSFTEFPNFLTRSAWRWLDKTHLEVLRAEDDTTTDVLYQGYALDVRTGETSQTISLKIPAGYHITNIRSNRVIVGRSDWGLFLHDFVKNQTVKLPPPAFESLIYSWKPELNTLAYVAKGTNKPDEPELLLVTPEGVVSRQPVNPVEDAKYEVASIVLSPDGEKVFGVVQRRAPWFIGLGQLRVYDTKRKQARTIGRVPIVGTLLYFIANVSSPYPQAQWTPDSRSIIWAHTQPMFDENNTYEVGTVFHLFPYEDTVEKEG